MRDVNAELMSCGLVRCPECGDRFPNHPVKIQQHYRDRHNIAEQRAKREKGWNFKDATAIKNPLSLKNIFNRA